MGLLPLQGNHIPQNYNLWRWCQDMTKYDQRFKLSFTMEDTVFMGVPDSVFVVTLIAPHPMSEKLTKYFNS